MDSSFYAARLAYDALDAAATEASRRLNAIPGIGSGPMGLTPDSVKFSAEYRRARAEYDAAAGAFKRYAGAYCKRYKKELQAERAARRAAGRL